MFGYLLFDGEQVPQEFNAGFSLYAAAWPLVDHYPGHDFQTGLLSTWMHPLYEAGQKPKEECYTDIEGGLGWWRDTHFPTTTPKFIMGGVGPNFSVIANGPGYGAGSWEEERGLYGVAQLSPWLLFPLDGLNLKQGAQGELFGYGYLPLPLTDPKSTTAGTNLPTSNQCWTLFLNTASFKGPAAFFTPHFWSRALLKNPQWAGKLLDSARPTRTRPSRWRRSTSRPSSARPRMEPRSPGWRRLHFRSCPTGIPPCCTATPCTREPRCGTTWSAGSPGVRPPMG